jgi:hypothetical protein
MNFKGLKTIWWIKRNGQFNKIGLHFRGIEFKVLDVISKMPDIVAFLKKEKDSIK